MNILQMSYSAAVLIIAVVILRALTLYKLPKKTFLVLWGVVICRLLIPFSIPCRISFYTGIDMLKGTSMKTTYFTTPAITTNTFDIGMADIGKLADSGTSTISIAISPLMLIWLIGMGVCAIFFIVTYIKCYREFKTALPIENDFITIWQQKHPIRLPVQIRQSDRINAPLTYGTLRPVVLLPKKTDWTDETKLQYILTHEYVHIKRFDALTKLLLAAALCIHWFNPFVWVMYILANRDIELSCDEIVVKTFGEPMKSSYALTLIGLEEKKGLLTPLCNNFSKNAIEERINAIMKIKKYSAPIIILAVLLVVGITVGFLTSNAKSSNNSDSQDNANVLTDTSPDAATLVDVTGNIDKVPNPYLKDNSSQISAEPDSAPIIDEEKTAESVSSLNWVWPCEGDHITSLYGNRFHPVSGKYDFNDHIDIAGDKGTLVYAALNGTVFEASSDDEQGNYIVISHGSNIKTIYRHLGKLQVSVGDIVAAGDRIGTFGSTGKDIRARIAFCVYVDGTAVNPLDYLQKKF
jgi:beta-lactamase regulating signal transducer with metallopeptidase domain